MCQIKFLLFFIFLNSGLCPLFAQNYYAKDQFEKGEIELHVGDFGQAVKYYDQAIASYSLYTQAFFSRGKAHYYLQQFEKAQKDFEKAFALDAKRVDALFYKSVILYQQKSFEKAIEILNNALERDPGYAIAYNYRAECYRELGLNSQAIKDYGQAIRLDPIIPTLYVGRGQCYLANENYTEAVEDFTEAIRLEPRKFEYYRYRAEAQFLKGEYTLASKDMDFLASEDTNTQSYEHRLNAFCKASVKDYAGAISVISQLLRNHPEDIDLLVERADYFKAQKKSLEAIKDYEKALKAEPQNIELHFACGELYIQTEQYEAAQPHLRVVLEERLEDAEVWYLMGVSYYHLQEKSKAKYHLIKAAQLGYPAENMPTKIYKLAKKGYRR